MLRMRTNENKEIGIRLEVTRLALGYEKQTEFVAALQDVIPMIVQRWNAYECGRERITVPVALALCARFDLSLDWIYRGKKGQLPQQLAKAIEAIEKSRR